MAKRLKGFFELKRPEDLFKKLEHEYALLQGQPDNAYHAFNFFVTAEHLLDWLFPGSANRGKREVERKGSIVLQVCSHIANGAKHFEVEAKHHQSVSNTDGQGSYFAKGWFHKNWWARGYFRESQLVVRLTGDAESAFGKSITAIDLAGKTLEYWRNHRGLAARP